jgi:hypothetical protein
MPPEPPVDEPPPAPMAQTVDEIVSPGFELPSAAPVERQMPAPPGEARMPLSTALMAVQGALWATCVLVVLVGGLVLLGTLARGNDPAAHSSTAIVFASLAVGAYVLARAAEKGAGVLARYLEKRSGR